METKSEKKIKYRLDIQSRGAKRDVYLLLDNGERRHIFTITPVMITDTEIRFVLRHVKKGKLGALIDVVGLFYFQNIITNMYWMIVTQTGNFLDGQYLFTAIITDIYPDLKGIQCFFRPKYFKYLKGYVLEKKLIKQ